MKARFLSQAPITLMPVVVVVVEVADEPPPRTPHPRAIPPGLGCPQDPWVGAGIREPEHIPVGHPPHPGVAGGVHNGNVLGDGELVAVVGVHVHSGEEHGLAGVGVYPPQQQQVTGKARLRREHTPLVRLLKRVRVAHLGGHTRGLIRSRIGDRLCQLNHR